MEPVSERDEEQKKVHRATSEKTGKILDACKRKDVARLCELAESPAGLVSDALRREACKYPI
jgi:hypothetical protein